MLPTYFIGHGGVNMLFTDDHRFDHYRAQLLEIGKEIESLKPKAIIAVSGHFESPDESTVLINVKEKPGVEYSYRFKHEPFWYEFKFNHHNNLTYAHEVEQALKNKGLKVKEVQADTDHGIWVPGKLLFPKKEDEELEIPIISVSTVKTTKDNFELNVKIGEALQGLRNQGYIILNLGMIVHNLELYRDISLDPENSDKAYAARDIKNTDFEKDFTKEIEDLLTKSGRSERNRVSVDYSKGENLNFNYSHPTFEHYTPFLVFLGSSTDEDKGFNYERNGFTPGMSYSNYKLSN